MSERHVLLLTHDPPWSLIQLAIQRQNSRKTSSKIRWREETLNVIKNIWKALNVPVYWMNVWSLEFRAIALSQRVAISLGVKLCYFGHILQWGNIQKPTVSQAAGFYSTQYLLRDAGNVEMWVRNQTAGLSWLGSQPRVNLLKMLSEMLHTENCTLSNFFASNHDKNLVEHCLQGMTHENGNCVEIENLPFLVSIKNCPLFQETFYWFTLFGLFRGFISLWGI